MAAHTAQVIDVDAEDMKLIQMLDFPTNQKRRKSRGSVASEPRRQFRYKLRRATKEIPSDEILIEQSIDHVPLAQWKDELIVTKKKGIEFHDRNIGTQGDFSVKQDNVGSEESIDEVAYEREKASEGSNSIKHKKAKQVLTKRVELLNWGKTSLRQQIVPFVQRTNDTVSKGPTLQMITDGDNEEFRKHSMSSSVPPNDMVIPFVKYSPFWKTIESMEVFRRIPQQPHFKPLEKQIPELREGAAIGLMISFSSLVYSIGKLQVSDEQTTIKEKLTALELFEENGFDVNLLRSRIEKLLEFKVIQSQYEFKKSSLNVLILEKQGDALKLSESMASLDNSIFEFKQKLKQSRDERELLYLRKRKNESEVSQMQKDVQKTEEAFISSANDFNASLATFLEGEEFDRFTEP